MFPAPRRSWKFFSKYNRTLNSMRFVTTWLRSVEYSACVSGFAPRPDPTGAVRGPRWGTWGLVPSPPFVPPLTNSWLRPWG